MGKRKEELGHCFRERRDGEKNGGGKKQRLLLNGGLFGGDRLRRMTMDVSTPFLGLSPFPGHSTPNN